MPIMDINYRAWLCQTFKMEVMLLYVILYIISYCIVAIVFAWDNSTIQ